MKKRIFAFLMLMVAVSAGSAQDGESQMALPEQYLVELIGTRPTWPDDMTPDEEKIMSEHFEYLKKLTHDRKVIAAGPVFDFKFGLIILQVESEREAREIMEKEPSVTKGLHTYKMSKMRVSLLCDYTPPFRFVTKPNDRAIIKEVVVTASLDDVWDAWTTTDGVRTFFSPDARVEFKIGGPYEIYFDSSAPYGLRGSEFCRVLSYLPKKILSFEWNAPPSFAELRDTHTIVVLQFESLTENQIKVTLTHHGWGENESWQKVYDYFDKAWAYVLSNFEKRFKDGPLQWK